MSRKAGRQQAALRRERERSRAVEQRCLEGQVQAEVVAADRSMDVPPTHPALDPRPNPATGPPLAAAASPRTGSGRRAPGQQIACGWCERPVLVRAHGPLPKWCSPACRHRAWEQQRAARSGRSAVQVLDRYVPAVPADGPGWIDHLAVLATQVGAGPRLIPDTDLDQLAAALELAFAAVADRTRWRGQHPQHDRY